MFCSIYEFNFQLEIANFRDAFERGEDPLADMTDASDINSVAGVLKLYFRELREPIFPIIYFDQFMEFASKKSEGTLILERSPIPFYFIRIGIQA
jgi:SLIT-ROBO Rho GTPase activating protein